LFCGVMKKYPAKTVIQKETAISIRFMIPIKIPKRTIDKRVAI
jgi:hypothetical protein